MTDEKYNGYTNYETWCVNLWLTNDLQTYNSIQEFVKDTIDGIALEVEEIDSRTGESMSVLDYEATVRVRLADALKDYIEEWKDEFMEAKSIGACLWADMLNASISGVDWLELAKEFYDNYKESRT